MKTINVRLIGPVLLCLLLFQSVQAQTTYPPAYEGKQLRFTVTLKQTMSQEAFNAELERAIDSYESAVTTGELRKEEGEKYIRSLRSEKTRQIMAENFNKPRRSTIEVRFQDGSVYWKSTGDRPGQTCPDKCVSEAIFDFESGLTLAYSSGNVRVRKGFALDYLDFFPAGAFFIDLSKPPTGNSISIPGGASLDGEPFLYSATGKATEKGMHWEWETGDLRTKLTLWPSNRNGTRYPERISVTRSKNGKVFSEETLQTVDIQNNSEPVEAAVSFISRVKLDRLDVHYEDASKSLDFPYDERYGDLNQQLKRRAMLENMSASAGGNARSGDGRIAFFISAVILLVGWYLYRRFRYGQQSASHEQKNHDAS